MVWLALFVVLAGLWGCPLPRTDKAAGLLRADEKAYALRPGQTLRVPLKEGATMVYRFDVEVAQDGLYQFETLGEGDSICALVRESKRAEHFLVVRDTGGEKDNCRLIWAFSAGKHTIKARVDGRSHFLARLKRIPWRRLQHKKLSLDRLARGVVEHIRDRHRFRIVLPGPRLIQLRVRAEHQLQCILRHENGAWLARPTFAQPYGSCVLGKWLPAGRYALELRANRPQTVYALHFQMLRMQKLPSDRVQQGYIHPKSADVYEITLRARRRQILETHGRLALACQLEDHIGHVFKRVSIGPDGRNCRFEGQLPPGRYYFRVRLRKGRSGPYLVSFRQQSYRALRGGYSGAIVPNFQTPMQLYQIRIDKPRLYQISVTGRSVRCAFQSANQRSLSMMNLSRNKTCTLFARLSRGTYFLKVYPEERTEGPYNLRIKPYAPPKGAQLENEHPRLLGPAYRGYQRQFTFRIKTPQIVVLETHGALDTSCTLFGHTGMRVAYDDDSGKKYNCKLSRYLKPGRYKVRVHIDRHARGLFWLQRRTRLLPRVVVNRPVLRKLTSKTRPHTYLFSVARAGMFSIQTMGKTDTQCSLFNSDWRLLSSDDDSGKGRNCFFTQVLPRGDYPLQVKLYRKPGEYSLLISRLSPRLLRVGLRLKGRLRPPFWSDVFRVKIAKAGLYKLGTFGKEDTECALLNAQGKVISSNDDPTDNDKNCALLENLNAGTYYFRVRLHASSNKRLAARTYEVEVRERSIAPRRLVIGKYLRAELRQASLLEFLFVLKRAGSYHIETRGQSADPRCLLFDQARHKLAEDDNGGVNKNCRIQHVFQPGTYILQVRTASPSRASAGAVEIGITKQKP